jgi:hypothetical protein
VAEWLPGVAAGEEGRIRGAAARIDRRPKQRLSRATNICFFTNRIYGNQPWLIH